MLPSPLLIQWYLVPYQLPAPPCADWGLAEQVAEQALMCDTLLSGAQNAAQPKLIMQVDSVRQVRATDWRSREERGLQCQAETIIRPPILVAQPLTVVFCPLLISRNRMHQLGRVQYC